MKKRLDELRNNRLGKGLHVEPTDDQIFRLWEFKLQHDFNFLMEDNPNKGDKMQMQATLPTQNPFTSVTNWTNFIITIVGILSLPELKAVVPEYTLPYIVLAIGILNLLLRNFRTSEPTTQFAARRTEQ